MEILEPDFPIAAARASVPAHVVYRAFAAETVILNLETGKYHGVNATGGRMLELLDRCGSVAEALQAFAQDYRKQPAEIEQDIRAFCTRLHERGLIEITLGGAG
jgi:hypothetical protein